MDEEMVDASQEMVDASPPPSGVEPVGSGAASFEALQLPQPTQTVVVSPPGGPGDYSSLAEALVAHPSSCGTLRLVVHAGTYAEVGLQLHDNLQIVAAEGCVPGSDTAVVLTSRQDRPILMSSATGAVVRGLQIENRGPFGSMASILVEGGDARFESCLITGSGCVGLLICGASTPTVVGCELVRCSGDGIKVVEMAAPNVSWCNINNNHGFGIFCSGASTGVYRNNSISCNSNAGVACRGTCTARFEKNELFDGKQGGFWMEENSKCTVVGNDIYQNQKSGIQVGGRADPLVRTNIVRDGLKGGIVVHDHAMGHFVQNEIMRNTMAGVGGTDFACPVFHANVVKNGKGGGIVLHEHCKGVFEKNQVVNNTHAGIGLKGSSNALFDSNYISDGSGYGVWVQEKSTSTLQNNVIERNMRAGVVVTDSANPTLIQNIIRDGKHAGLLIRHTATGRFRQNTVSHNAHGNMVLLEQVSSQLIANIISHGPLGGIIIRGTSTALVRGNTICHNDGANIAVLDDSNPVCDGNCLTNGAGRGLVIMDNARGTYRFNMIRDSELAGVYVGRQASPEMVANCICDGKAAGILFEDEACGNFTHNIVCSNQNEGVAVHGRAHPTLECNVVLQGLYGGIWLDINAGGHFRGNVVEDSGVHGNAYRAAGVRAANETRLAERNTNTAPAALAEVLSQWVEEKMRSPGGNNKVILIQNPDTESPGGGMAMATQCSELMGLDPSRSCMLVARFLGDAGQFEDAEDLIKMTKGFLGESGPLSHQPAMRGQQLGDMSLHCAELLNKWAAASTEYSRDLMVRAADYAREAATVFMDMQPQTLSTIENFASALYWMILNFATVCRVGGGGDYTAEQACALASEALTVAHSMVTDSTPAHRLAELAFVDGIVCFCQSEAIASSFLEVPADAGPPEFICKDLLAQALTNFEQAYKLWCEAYGDKHLQTVKAITMIGLLQSRINGKEAGIEWSRRELRIREELQGELHPRTQQARRNYMAIIEERLQCKGPDHTAIDLAIKSEAASSGNASTVIVAKMLSENGEFENAEKVLQLSQQSQSPAELETEPSACDSNAKFDLNFPSERRSAEISLYCAEILNKWAASSPEYTKDVMIRAAEYALQAKEYFEGEIDSGNQNEMLESLFGESLYWMGLNFATMCRLGGGGRWGCQQSYDIANAALARCQKLRTGPDVAEHLTAEVTFAQGVLSFCKAEAVKAGHLKSIKMEKAILVERKYLQALQLFQHSYKMWTSVFGEKHLETVKAVTMIGAMINRLQGGQAAMQWYRKELKMREELQGEMHPRTQQARRIYTSTLDAKLAAERRDVAAGADERMEDDARGALAPGEQRQATAGAELAVGGGAAR